MLFAVIATELVEELHAKDARLLAQRQYIQSLTATHEQYVAGLQDRLNLIIADSIAQQKASVHTYYR